MVVVDADYLRQIEAARNDLRNIIRSNNCAPVMLRLAFHDAGTYDAKTKTGGVNGSIRFELNQGPNVGIKFGVDVCEEVKKKHPKVTYADIYQLGGIVAVEVTGGPAIHFVPGRDDAPQQNQDNALGLPNPGGDAQHLRDVFHRMGLTDRDIVVLSGAHTLGGSKNTNQTGTFTDNPLKFDNSYFRLLLDGGRDDLVQFDTDKALVTDSFLKKYVQLYAKNEQAFFEHYAESHKKMSELGFRHH